MVKNSEKVPQLKNWDIVKIHWLAQALANLFFGLSLALITLFYAGFSLEAAKTTILLYLAIYFLIFVPFYCLVPVFLFRKSKRILDKINAKEEVGEKDVKATIELLLGMPLKISLIIPLTVWSGFGLGAFILSRGLVPEFMPLIELVIVSCVSIAFGVGLMHSFFNYIFLDDYLRPIIDFLGLFYAGPIKKLRVQKLPLALKIFLVIFLVALASQVSLWAVFSARIGLISPPELKTAFFYASSVSMFTLVSVFVIAALFSRNITYPLKKLINWSGQVSRGEVKEEISIITNDEISEAVEYLKDMVKELEESRGALEIKVTERTKELKKLTEQLGEQVKERTKELEEKVSELEKFQKVAVGRELKMIELKKEINKLKGEARR